MSGYTKLFGSILESTVWLESPPVKVVWITLLAMADRDGVVEASVPGLAKRAGVDRVHCEQALAVFLAPDPDSRTTAFEGRRIEPIQGGWRLLNHDIYRERASQDEKREKAAARQRRKRDRDAVKSRVVTPVTQSNTESRQAEASPSPSPPSGEEDISSAPLAATEPALLRFPIVGSADRKEWALTRVQFDEWQALFPALDLLTESRKALAWVQANPERRKTAKGMPRFLVGWFSRSVDHHRGPVGGPVTKTSGNIAAGIRFLEREQK